MKKLKITVLLILGIAQFGISQSATGVFTQIPCNNDGIYTVTTVGIPLPITYTYYVGWSSAPIVHPNVNSATDQLTNFGMEMAGSVYCQITGGGGASAITQNTYSPAFAFDISATSPVCPQTMGIITANQLTGPTGPFTFNWTNNQTFTTYIGNNVLVPEGEYTVLISDQTTGCQMEIIDSSSSVQQISNVSGTVNATSANCTNGTASAVASGGIAPYAYLWSNGATSSTINNLSQGYYELTITDAQGCESSFLGAFVQQNPSISVNTTITNATCLQNDGSALAFGSGGQSPYTYAWSNGQSGNMANSLSANFYTVIATDANGCIGQVTAFVNSNTPINVTQSSTPSQCTTSTGTATLTISGGTAPYVVEWNTIPVTNGTTLSNAAPGNYPFEVTDAVGCKRTGSVLINQISTINAVIGASTVICPNTTGTVTVNVTGTNPPFTYLWSNGNTTNQTTGAAAGNQTCLITDALSCTVSKSIFVAVISPINLSVTANPASCIFNTNGSATSLVSGGTAPYTYSYTNGATTPNAIGLGVGYHTLNVQDAVGCTQSKHFSIGNNQTSTSCYATISGTVFVDANADCILNGSETGVQNIMMHCSGFGYKFTDANGNYSFQVPTGTYTITEQVNAYYPLATCQNTTATVSVVAGSTNATANFANNVITIHDLKIVTVNSNIPPIPGNTYSQKVIVKNEGTVTEAGIQLGYEHDDQMPFAASTSPNFLQLNPAGAPYWYSIQSGFPALSPNASNVMLLSYNTPTNIPLGTVVDFFDTVAHVAPLATSWLTDYTPWNNVNLYQTTVIGSYDPNYKEVSPKGLGAAGYISSTVQEFDYTIHFQNEGTYFAQNIYITDQLDPDFDWLTFKPGYSDYTYNVTVSETGLVTFNFPNINLPWKDQYGDALSSGLVNYSIDKLATATQGTEFDNTAYIYFDFNTPIITNTTINTINDALASAEEIETEISEAISLDLYPVPAKDFINVRLNNVSKYETATFQIIDLMGNIVLSSPIELQEGSIVFSQNTSNLANGTYLTRIQFETGASIVKKIVVSK